MNLIDIIQSEYLSILFGGAAGVVTAWATQRVLNKRGVFRYFVNHQRVGMSTEDEIFGSVAVTWNGNPIQHLYFSTLELRNESLNDYENVVVRTYTSDANLLSEQTQIVDTPNIIEWTEKYRQQLFVPAGEVPTDNQRAIYFGQREYLVPVFNRGQVVRISYLSSAKTEAVPHIWLSVTQKGVRVKFQGPQNHILGESQSRAAFAGVVIGVIGVFPLVLYSTNLWVVGGVALTYGLIAQIPGAYAIKLFRKGRELIGG